MKAVERIFLSNDLITYSFLIGLVLLFLMKLYKPKRLLGYSIAFFTQGFIEKRAEDNPSFFSPFHGMIFLFSILTFSVFFYVQPFFVIEQKPINFLLIILGVLGYFVLVFSINYVFSSILGVRERVQYFLFSKSGYLYALCLWLFPVLIIYKYGFTNFYFFAVATLFLFVFRGFLIFRNNKKLIFSQLFYFILYFCTLELAPLLILYKTITV